MLEMFTPYLASVILIACAIVGYIIKNLIPNDEINRYIPAIVTVLGIFLNIWNSGWLVTLPVVVTGAVSGLASTGLYELIRQLLSKMNELDFSKSDEGVE